MMWRRAWNVFVLALAVTFAAPAWAAEVSRGIVASADQSYRTDYFITDSGEPGPLVLIVGGMHGNEPAGAAAAEQIRHWPIARGKMIVLPRANPAALAANTRRLPDLKGDDGDLNRHFPRDDEGFDATDSPIAAALWQFVREQKPDWVIDLHEGYDFRQLNQDTVGSSVIHFSNDIVTPLAKRMIEAVNVEIDEEPKKFVRLARGGPIGGSLSRAAAKHLGAEAMIVETTSKAQPLSWRVRQHRLMMHALLRDIGVLAADASPHVMAPPAPARRDGDDRAMQVAVYDAAGTGRPGVPNLRRIIDGMDHAAMCVVGPADILDGVLTQFDLVIFPGGSGSKQAAAIGEGGRENVRQFVQGGGAYIGICAGAYLGTSGYDWGLKLIDARTVDSRHWRRGVGDVQMELTPGADEVLGRSGLFTVRYANGPLFGPAERDDLPDYDVLAWFRSELAKNGAPSGVMTNTPAIIAAPFGEGRVMLISCHPESSLPWLIEAALKWAAPAHARPLP